MKHLLPETVNAKTELQIPQYISNLNLKVNLSRTKVFELLALWKLRQMGALYVWIVSFFCDKMDKNSQMIEGKPLNTKFIFKKQNQLII